VAEMTKNFYCELCDKQYTRIAEYETHLSSYDHNHKKRFKDMRDFEAERNKEDRLKKQKKREEKERKEFEAMIARKAAASRYPFAFSFAFCILHSSE
jgi:hypothetical protein